MSTHVRPTAMTAQMESPYTLRQVNKQGNVLSEKQVVASSCANALRELGDVVDGARRIEAYNQKGNKAGEVDVDYWRLKRGRR